MTQMVTKGKKKILDELEDFIWYEETSHFSLKQTADILVFYTCIYAHMWSTMNHYRNLFLLFFWYFIPCWTFSQLAVSSLLSEAVWWLVEWSAGRLMLHMPWSPTGKMWHSSANILGSNAASPQLRPALMENCRHQPATLVNLHSPFRPFISYFCYICLI